MKKILSIAVASLMTATMAFSTLSVSAASGVDIVDTFESYYGKKDLITSTWKTDGAFAGNISTDTNAAAPNRGNGKDKGNYRSMKASFDFAKDTWGSVRDMTEDSYALITPINANKDVNFTFYAKADKAMTIMAEIDIKDCPFYSKVKLTTEWKKYTLNIRDLTPELKDKNGNLTKIYERNSQQAWGNGKEEAFLVGFKFQINKDDNSSISNGSFWIDTLAFEGSTISERSEDNTQDKLGTVPADYKADTSVSSGSTGGNTSSGSTSGATGGVTSSSTATGGNITNSSDGTSSKSDENSSEITDASSDDSSVSDESGTDSSAENNKDEENDLSDGTKKMAMSTGTKAAIIIVIVLVVAGAGAAAYFFIIKKKKEQK